MNNIVEKYKSLIMNYPLPLKKIVHKFKYFLRRMGSDKYMYLDWVTFHNNFGDIMNPVIISFFSSSKIINVKSTYCNSIHLLAIGSILDRANSKSIIWGSGFISETSKCTSAPKKIYAVRGPLTRNLLKRSGIDCPKVYGDPALLLSKYYKPKIIKRYKVGILAHYVDKDNEWIKSLSPSVRIINVQNPNVLSVIDQMCECENIISSSLHGLIISDTYGIPSLWIRFSDKVIGGDFKFLDYFASIHSDIERPFMIKSSTIIEDLINNCKLRELNIDLNKLEDSFPKEFI